MDHEFTYEYEHIERGTIYPIRQVLQCLLITRHEFRALGLPTRKVGHRRFVLGDDIIDRFMDTEAEVMRPPTINADQVRATRGWLTMRIGLLECELAACREKAAIEAEQHERDLKLQHFGACVATLPQPPVVHQVADELF